jgi:alginate O-acetyltransferase complex protein AlgI
MLFNSFNFWLFFAAVFAAVWLAPRAARNPLLLAASYAFYAFWDWRFLGLLVLSTAIDYGCGLAMAAAPSAKRRWLWTSVASHLAILGTFKYYDFFAASLAEALGTLGLDVSPRLLNVAVPWGLSFYTFQSMGYAIDVYRGARPARDPLNYALFVSFFPQLLAGPIERARDLMPQVEAARRLTGERLAAGAYFIGWGLFQKCVVADNLAPRVDAVFAGPPPDGALALAAVFAFTVQIACDFSGYADMARGLGQWLGFDLSANFRAPFFASSPADFWKRWHVTLSRWFTDYVHGPLVWSSRLPAKLFLAPVVTMLLMGLWHGARGTMLLMGAYYGALLAAQAAWARARQARGLPPEAGGRLGRLLAAPATFALTCLGFLLFRADSAAQAADFLAAVFFRFGPGAEAGALFLLTAALSAPVWIAQYFERRLDEPLPFRRLPLAGRAVFWLAVVYGILVLGEDHVREFIYFRF